jgi:hypothetical protein
MLLDAESSGSKAQAIALLGDRLALRLRSAIEGKFELKVRGSNDVSVCHSDGHTGIHAGDVPGGGVLDQSTYD